MYIEVSHAVTMSYMTLSKEKQVVNPQTSNSGLAEEESEDFMIESTQKPVKRVYHLLYAFSAFNPMR